MVFLWKIASDYPDVEIFALGVAVGVLIFTHLHRAAKSEFASLDRARLVEFMDYGLLVFGLGYAIFLTNANIQLTATGIGNRTAIAASTGVSLWIVRLPGS